MKIILERNQHLHELNTQHQINQPRSG